MHKFNEKAQHKQLGKNSNFGSRTLLSEVVKITQPRSLLLGKLEVKTELLVNTTVEDLVQPLQSVKSNVG